MTSFTLLKRHPLLPLIVGIFFVLSCVCGGQKNVSNLDSNSNQGGTNKEPLKITNITIRIGKRDIVRSLENKFDFKTYQGSALTTVDETISEPKDDAVIFVPFKSDVEIDVNYNETNISETGLISGSYFQIIPDPKEGKPNQDVTTGKRRSYLINKTRAVALVSPWIWAPYNNGGTVKVALYLYTSSGEKFERVFVFQVGTDKDIKPSNQSNTTNTGSKSPKITK